MTLKMIKIKHFNFLIFQVTKVHLDQKSIKLIRKNNYSLINPIK